MRYLSIICFFVLAHSQNSFAQEKYLMKGDKAFQNKEYAKALELYKKSFESGKLPDKTTKYIHYPFRMAECYRMLGDIKNEERFYAMSIKGKCGDTLAFLYLADLEKLQGNYDDAMGLYKQHKSMVPKDSRAMME